MGKNEPRMHLSTIAGIALAGCLAGAVAGVLLAPKRGKELRQDIRKLMKTFHKDSQDFPQPGKTGYITLKNPKDSRFYMPEI